MRYKTVRISFTLAFLCLIGSVVSRPAMAQAAHIDAPLVPPNASPGASAFTLIVNGAGFVPASVVQWNGSPRATTYITSEKLAAVITSGDLASPGTASVIVYSPGPPASSSNVMFFEITVPTTSVTFASRDYGVGSNPSGVATGDFNGDGKLDLAVANANDGTVSILLGNGDGTFQPAINYAVGGAFSIAVADFNGDGKPDLAVSLQTESGGVAVLLGKGDGTFQPAAYYAADSDSQSVAVGDFNADGNLDLVVSNYNAFTVSVLLGNGDGTFRAPTNYRVGSSPRAVVVADFNGDGKLDLATANQDSGTVSVLLGNGDGSFQGAVNYPCGNYPQSIATADLNGDGTPDLVVANQNGLDIGVMLGNGDGTFQAPVHYPVPSRPQRITLADLNGDGKLDLAVGYYACSDNNPPPCSNNTFGVSLGNGDGSFQAPANFVGGTFFDTAPAFVAADFNGDGRMDLAEPLSSGHTISVLLQPTPYSAAVQSPISADGSSVFHANRGVVPVKFTLALYGAPTCALPAAMISVFRMSGSNLVSVNQSDYIMSADSGTSFRIDAASCQYVYNLDARTLGPGKYTINISNADIVIGTAVFALQ